MKIFYLKISELLKIYTEEEISNYADTHEIKSSKRFIQHCAGRFLIKNVFKKIYNVQDPQIYIYNKKPKLKNGEIHFSLAHSADYVIGVFDNSPCGIDLEYMRPVNLNLLSKRYNKSFKTSEDFYKFWTKYEAAIKLGTKAEFEYISTFKNEYTLTLLSSDKSPSPIEFTDFLKTC